MPWLDAAWHGPGWIDGPLPFDPADRGLLLGDGAFDTALVLGGQMVWRGAHVARLLEACATLGFVVERARVDAAIDAALARHGEGSLRVTATRGPGPRGLAPPVEPHPTIVATCAPPNRAAIGAPLRLHTVAIRRNETSPLANLKSLNYGDAVLAAAAARRASCDDALLLNGRGHVACTTTGNVFAVFGTELITPPLADGVVPGIARAVLLNQAAALGLTGSERSLRPGDLAAADAVLVTNSLRLVAPVAAIDGDAVGCDGKLAARMRDLLVDRIAGEVRVDPRAIRP